MDVNVKCEIEATGESCQDYIQNISSTSNECSKNVLYTYIGENIGTKCKEIVSIESTMMTSDVTTVSQIPLTFWTESMKLFCPGESVTIVQPVFENLCALAGTDVGIILKINGEKDDSKFGFIEFPISNQITSSPIPSPTPAPTPAPVPQIR